MDRATALSVVARLGSELRRARGAERRAAEALEQAIVAASIAGVPQRDIAASADVSQPYISKLLSRRRRFVPRSALGELISAKRADVLRIIERYGAGNVRIFGSVARGADVGSSDVDLLIDIPDGMGLFALGRLEKELSDALGVKVDVVPARLLRPDVRVTAERDAVPL